MELSRRAWLIGAGGMVLVGAAQESGAAVTAKTITYKGWDDATLLSNKVVELVFVPQIGRIMRYGYIGGPNLLWNNAALTGKTTDFGAANADWQNYGGDKLWPAPQARWGWPPDPVMDSGAQTVKILPHGKLHTQGPRSPKHNLRFRREITLDATGTGVTLLNVVMNVGDKEAEWSVWEVAQVDSPDVVIMPLHKGGKFPTGYYTFKDSTPAEGRLKISGNEIRLERDPKNACKIGGDSPLGWIASEKSGVRFEVSHKVEAKAHYPDDGCHLEIYTNPDPASYIEMELLSPLVMLSPGEKYSHTTRWKLSK
jgi:hypothetical protein